MSAQEHISFNGATFGQTKYPFISALKLYGEGHLIEHTHKNMYHRYYYSGGYINSYNCRYYIHCSIKEKIVFETIAWFFVDDLEAEITPFVKVFEEKYGGHIKEDVSGLGYKERTDSFRRKEILALKYTIRRKTDNKPIGEVRISADTFDTTKRGYIEITYRDYASAKIAISEYNNIMNDIL